MPATMLNGTTPGINGANARKPCQKAGVAVMGCGIDSVMTPGCRTKQCCDQDVFAPACPGVTVSLPEKASQMTLAVNAHRERHLGSRRVRSSGG